MKILEATAMIAERTEAKIVPVRISGAAYSKFSYFRHKQLLRYFPKITLTVLPAQSIDKDLTVSGKKRRKLNAIRLYDIMSNLLLESTNTDMNFAQAFVEAMKVHGKKYIIAEDQERKCVDYKTILLKANVLGRALARLTKNELRLGFMLPSSLAGIVSFLGFHLTQKNSCHDKFYGRSLFCCGQLPNFGFENRCFFAYFYQARRVGIFGKSHSGRGHAHSLLGGYCETHCFYG